MTRSEKIGGLLLGLVLFACLFYLIYDSFLSVPYQELSTEPFIGGLEATPEPGLETTPGITEENAANGETEPETPAPENE
jgi:hypothetical protein